MASNPKIAAGHIPEDYYNVPLAALSIQTRHEISLHLDPNISSGNNWQMFAQMIGLRSIEIDNIQLRTNMTECVLREAIRRNYTVGKFLQIMRDHPLERMDLIAECANLIAKDVGAYRPVQVAEVSSETSPILTMGQLSTGMKEYFDAFVSYHPEDHPFIEILVNKVETEFGMKLCIRERDLCMGVSENAAIAELMEKRCKRVILVLSQNYMESEELQAILKWQMQFAQALAPGAGRMHKIVPLLINTGIAIPSILLPYNVSDYTKSFTREWFWKRLEGSLSAPTHNSGGYEGPAGKLGKRPGCIGEEESVRRREPLSRESNRNRPRAITGSEEMLTEGTTDSTGEERSSGSEYSSLGINSLTEPTSVFYVPLPTGDTKKKKKYRWNKTNCNYTS